MSLELEWNQGSKQDDYITLFVDVIIPLPVPQIYTYRVPNDWNDLVFVGSRVIVQFGAKKIYTAIVTAINDVPPQKYEAKLLMDVLDAEPLISQKQLDFFHWMSDYYLAHPGEVLIAALPAGLKLNSESTLQSNPDYTFEPNLSMEEEALMTILQKKESIPYSEAEKLLKIKGFSKLVKQLINRGALLIFEKVKDKYTPKTIRKIRLSEDLLDHEQLETVINSLEKKEKQLTAVMTYLSQSNCMSRPELNFNGIAKNILTDKGVSDSSLKTLIKNGILEEFKQQVSRFVIDHNTEDKKELNEHQITAYDEIKTIFEEKSTCLLHGITGSGKTEIYIHLIEEQIKQGKQVLYLLPEIALSTQIYSRLRKIFGSSLGVYHSRFSDNERVELYKGLKSGDYQIILGVRSSLFLPFENLGLIIVDEEHDSSYKQYDPSPRYHARDAALMLGHMHGAKVLLGTATPSLESYFLAKEGKYGLVELNKRHGESILPEILLAPAPFVKDGVNYFSDTFIKNMSDTISEGNQAIVFQNRRGYSPYMLCKKCEHIPMCINCNVSLTYHKFTHELRCHYCGHSHGIPTNCEECGSTDIHTIGMGTEKLEDDLNLVFKDANISRLDTDTARSKSRLEKIFEDFKSQKTNILIGTQMVTKGLDFEHVTLVAVFDIDRMLFFPDFRASERVVQLLTQISGRAGRSKKKGKVLIQTNNPKHELIQSVVHGTFQEFYAKEIGFRKQFFYPPYCRLIKITIKNADKSKVERTSLYLGRILKEKFGSKSIIGPEEPIINRVRNQYLEQIYFKLPKNQKFIKEVKLYLLEIIAHVALKPDYKTSRIVLDVDPV